MIRRCAIVAVAACNHATPLVNIVPEPTLGVGELYALDALWVGPYRVKPARKHCEIVHPGDAERCRAHEVRDEVSFKLDVACDRPCLHHVEPTWEYHQLGVVAVDRAGPLHVRVTMIPHVRRPSFGTYAIDVVDPTAVVAVCRDRRTTEVDCASPDAYDFEVHGRVAGRDYRAWIADFDGVARPPQNLGDQRYAIAELHGRVDVALGGTHTTVDFGTRSR
jgi:hypothetical protein